MYSIYSWFFIAFSFLFIFCDFVLHILSYCAVFFYCAFFVFFALRFCVTFYFLCCAFFLFYLYHIFSFFSIFFCCFLRFFFVFLFLRLCCLLIMVLVILFIALFLLFWPSGYEMRLKRLCNLVKSRVLADISIKIGEMIFKTFVHFFELF